MYTAIFKDQKIYLYEKETQEHPELSYWVLFLISKKATIIVFKILPIEANM